MAHALLHDDVAWLPPAVFDISNLYLKNECSQCWLLFIFLGVDIYVIVFWMWILMRFVLTISKKDLHSF
ncbi:hypothetical protein C1692_14590 [Klebsiella pneumoniae]|nr:hypothetical protein C1692_14590 [Klebsiella pneumoniae]